MRKLFIIGLCVGAMLQTAYATNYMAIVDAGSSGSRLYLYRYSLTKKIPQIELLASKKIEPGLSSFANNLTQIPPYLDTLLKFASNKLAANTKANTVKFILYSTAGMRLLTHPQQKKIYAAVKKAIAKYPKFKFVAAKTITGQWEAIYGWLASNYYLKTLYPDHTVGVLDMGGASTEITYATQDPEKHTIKLKIGPHSFNVYAKSYLGIGQNQIRHQYLNNKYCFNKGYIMPNGKSGAGSYHRCYSAIVPHLSDVKLVKKAHYVPRHMKFIAISVFHELTEYQIPELAIGFTAKTLMKVGSEICTKPWTKIKNNYSNPAAYTYCFNLAYFAALIYDGYKFNKNRYFDASHDVDWPLGVVFYNAYSLST